MTTAITRPTPSSTNDDFMVSVWPRISTLTPRGKCGPQFRHQTPDIDGNAAHVAALRAGIIYRSSARGYSANRPPPERRAMTSTRLLKQLRRDAVAAADAARTGVRSSCIETVDRRTAATAPSSCTPPRSRGSARRPGRSVCDVPAVDSRRSVVTSLGLKPSVCSCVRSMVNANRGLIETLVDMRIDRARNHFASASSSFAAIS